MEDLTADGSEEYQVPYGTVRKASAQEEIAYRNLTAGVNHPKALFGNQHDDEADEDEDAMHEHQDRKPNTKPQKNGQNDRSSVNTRSKQVLENDDPNVNEPVDTSTTSNKSQRISLLEDKNDDSGRRKIRIEFIDDDSRRHVTFSKRKTGIMKKAYELATLTGTQVLLLIVSQSDQVFTFATPKLQPIVMEPQGQSLIQNCLSQPDEVEYDPSYSHDGGLSDETDAPSGIVGSATPRASRISIQSARRRSVAKTRSDALRFARLGSTSSMSPAVPSVVEDDDLGLLAKKRQRLDVRLDDGLSNEGLTAFPEASSGYANNFAPTSTISGHEATEFHSNESASGSDHSSRLSAYSSPDMYRTSSIALASPPLQTLSLYNHYAPHQEHMGHYTPYQTVEAQSQRVQLHDHQQQRSLAAQASSEAPRTNIQQQYNHHYNLSPTSTSSISAPAPATFYQHMMHPGPQNHARGYGIEAHNTGN